MHSTNADRNTVSSIRNAELQNRNALVPVRPAGSRQLVCITSRTIPRAASEWRVAYLTMATLNSEKSKIFLPPETGDRQFLQISKNVQTSGQNAFHCQSCTNKP